MSYDVFPRKDVHFEDCTDTALHLGGPIAQKPQFWEHEYAFPSQMCKIFKLSYTKNYSMDSNQILSDDKDLQVHLVDDPKMCPTNTRWQTAAILKKKKNRHISSSV